MGLDFETCLGFCKACNETHSLGEGESRHHAVKLIEKLESSKRIDFDIEYSHPDFSTDYLFGEARGQMFGVLLCEDFKGREIVLKAYSCQYNSHWNVPGWVPPLLNVERYDIIVPPVDKKIKDLTRQIEAAGGNEAFKLKEQRKCISRKLMKEIHSLYALHNFKGEEKSLSGAFCLEKGIPAGTGDCCAPKLLNYAAVQNLKPIGISEFYFGRENKSGTRKHREFYSSCETKCQPILGFILCGMQNG